MPASSARSKSTIQRMPSSMAGSASAAAGGAASARSGPTASSGATALAGGDDGRRRRGRRRWRSSARAAGGRRARRAISAGGPRSGKPAAARRRRRRGPGAASARGRSRRRARGRSGRPACARRRAGAAVVAGGLAPELPEAPAPGGLVGAERGVVRVDVDLVGIDAHPELGHAVRRGKKRVSSRTGKSASGRSEGPSSASSAAVPPKGPARSGPRSVSGMRHQAGPSRIVAGSVTCTGIWRSCRATSRGVVAAGRQVGGAGRRLAHLDAEAGRGGMLLDHDRPVARSASRGCRSRRSARRARSRR